MNHPTNQADWEFWLYVEVYSCGLYIASSLPLSLVHAVGFCFMASKVVKKRHVLNNRSK